MKILIRYLTIFIVCPLLAFPQFSCSPFKQIKIENELGSYSLEYRSLYKREIRDNLKFNPPYAHLILEGPIKAEEAEVFDPNTGKIRTVAGKRVTSSITVTISNYKSYFGEAYSAADKIENVLEDEAEWANYKLLERSPLTVSGVQGEMIVYLVDKLMPIPREDGKNLEYVRAVFFDYNNLTWEIEAKCNQEIQDQVKADFDHIIQTFVILE
jgi:hypothetical protein